MKNEGMTEGYVLLVEAMMAQAYEDVKSNDSAIAEEAKDFIEFMKSMYC